MKTIVAALLALSTFAAAAAPASAYFPYNDEEPFDAERFFDYLQKHSG